MKDTLRPNSLANYLGQENIKSHLTVAMEAAKMRKEPLDHVLLNGPPGLGKTTLAKIIASEMGWKIKTILAPSLTSQQALGELFMNLGKGTILFIDEVHRMRAPIQEGLYPVLEDNKLYSWLGPVEIPIPPITIIAATTNIGKLARPFIDRFGLSFQLQYYEEEELQAILRASAEKMKIKITDGALVVIAGRSRGTPRIANNLLKRLRDYSEVQGDPGSEEFAAHILWTKMRIDMFGLNNLDRQYLRVLEDGSIMGVEAIAARMNEEADTVEEFIEPFLLNLGFVQRLNRGRQITPIGFGHLNNSGIGG